MRLEGCVFGAAKERGEGRRGGVGKNGVGNGGEGWRDGKGG